jgi:X-Pro dipeptidyl-peptidase
VAAALLAGCGAASPAAPKSGAHTAPSSAAANGPAGESGPKGESKPVYSYKKAVRETVWVDDGLDSDHDGKNDRIDVDIIRPSEPAAAGRKVPVIMDASAYYTTVGRGNESQRTTYDAQGRPRQFPLFYDNYFVPRGYAVAAVDLPGTGRSDGCTDAGGPTDIQSAKSAVDWLNGRATAYTTRTGDTRVKATWTTGATGMIGKSWDGSVANGVAATGVPGLRTIVPISAISSWYDAYFAQGAPLMGLRSGAGLIGEVETKAAAQRCAAVNDALRGPGPLSGDWSSLWSERDYVADAGKVRASVFAVQGLQDTNVRPQQFGQWWDALAGAGVERKVWLSLTGHVDPFDYRRSAWVDTLHQWFDHTLLGYDNGIDRQPQADIERSPGHWTTDAVWPPAGTSSVTLDPLAGPQPGVGTLGTHAGTGTEQFTGRGKAEAQWAATATTPTPDKVTFTTGPLTRDLRLSGSSHLTVTATPTSSAAYLSAALVDLGPATIRAYDAADGLGVTTLATRDCWGESGDGDSACFKQTTAHTAHVTATFFSRGAADLRNHASLAKSPPLTPGVPVTMTVDLAATDHVVPAGHRLALVIGGADTDLVLSPPGSPTVTVDLARTTLRLPVVGGPQSLPALG